MYTENSKGKVSFLLTDIFSVLLTYSILSLNYSYTFFSSKFFVAIYCFLIVTVAVFTDEYSDVLQRGYLKELKKSIFY